MFSTIILTLIAVPEIVKYVGAVFAVLAGVVTGYHQLVKTITRVRDNARRAEKDRQEEIQEKIDNAVEKERQRWLDHREDESDRIKRLQDIAGEWRSIAEQKDIRNRLLEEELGKVHEELAELRKLYVESQNRIIALEEVVREQTRGN